MRLPLIKSIKGRGKLIVYIPVDAKTRKRLSKATSVGERYAFHDSRIGWVERKRFKNYSAYIKYLKERNSQA